MSTNTAEPHEAWAVTTDGTFRRCFGGVWQDADMALPNGAMPSAVLTGDYSWIWALDPQNNFYRNLPGSQEPTPAYRGSGVLAAAQDGSGVLHLFGLDQSGQVWVSHQQSAEGGTWADWTALPTAQPFRLPVAGLDQDGTLETFCLGIDGLAYHAWQDAGSASGWSGFEPLGAAGQPPGVTLTLLATGRDATKLLWLFALGVDGQVWRVSQQPGAPTGWGDWAAFPASAQGQFAALAVGNDPGGQLEVFTVDSSGFAHHIWQDPQSSSGWSNWFVLGSTGQAAGVSLGGLVADRGPGEILYVFAIGADRAVYVIHGQAPGWNDWAKVGAIGGVQPLSVSTGTDAGGTFQVFMQGSDGAAYAAALDRTESWSVLAPLEPWPRRARRWAA